MVNHRDSVCDTIISKYTRVVRLVVLAAEVMTQRLSDSASHKMCSAKQKGKESRSILKHNVGRFRLYWN